MARREFAPFGYTSQEDDAFVLPVIGASSLEEILFKKGVQIVSYMDENRWFHWFDFEGAPNAFNMPVTDTSRVLHLRLVDEAVELFNKTPDAYVVVDNDTTEVPECLEDYKDHIIVTTCGGICNLSNLVSEIFMRMLRWENQMNYITNVNGSVTSLLNIGASMFDSFLYVAGVDNNIIGYSSDVDFPAPEYETIIHSGYLESSKTFVDKCLTKDFCMLSGSVVELLDDYDNRCLMNPIRYEGSLFGFLVMVVSPELEVTPAVKSQFAHFAIYAIEKCRLEFKAGLGRYLPHFYFLSALLRGDKFTRAAIEENLVRLNIPLDACYKVVVLNPRDSYQSVEVLCDSMRLLNNKKSFAVLFDDYVVGILFNERVDGALSHPKTLQDLEHYIYKPYGIVSGFSQVFLHISDVPLAFRQARYALMTRDVIETERLSLKEKEPLCAVSFEMVLPYFTIKENESDREFHEFCLSNSPLEDLLQSDLENGTNNFLLLWLFMLYERNASVVGRRLYMHRNSVLYHIKRIEERFDFDLDSWYIREKLLMDYRYLFLHLSDETLEQLLKSS